MRKFMVAIVFLSLAGLGAFRFVTAPQTISTGALGPYFPKAENGKSVFFAGGCASCHMTPGQDDAAKLGGGLPLRSPFGTFHVPNISPDRKDGIGGWSEAQFVSAMARGTSPDGAHYFPAFPYPSYRLMSVADLRDLFAYIKTLPAIPGKIRDHEIAFPFNARFLLGGWKLLFFDTAAFAPDPSQSPQWNRGAYLVNGPAHCAECHSPRNLLGGIVAAQRFAGGPNPEGEGWVPNITQAALKDWSVEDFEQLLEWGDKPGGRPILGSMVPVIRNTSQLSAEDRKAMAVYLKSLPPAEGPKPPARR